MGYHYAKNIISEMKVKWLWSVEMIVALTILCIYKVSGLFKSVIIMLDIKI